MRCKALTEQRQVKEKVPLMILTQTRRKEINILLSML